tara:strand:+ start:37 stop:420 length:384 start_codon:yes stop_codon:yes gene_type:complete
MARRKNTKRIDPRYFLHETTYRDEIEEQGSFTTNMPDNAPSTTDVMSGMSGGTDKKIIDAAMKAVMEKGNVLSRDGGDRNYSIAAIAQDAGVPLQALQTDEFKAALQKRGFTPPWDITTDDASVWLG